MNDYDQAARYAVQSNPLGFLRWLFPTLPEDFEFKGWLDTRTLPFPGEPDRTCDTVAWLAASSGLDWAAVVEFQSRAFRDMLERLLEYVIRVRRELHCGPRRRGRFHVVGGLVNLTGKSQTSTLEMKLPGERGVGVRFDAAVRNLRYESAAETLADIVNGKTASCLLPWIPLMQGAENRSIIEEWKVIADQERDRRVRGIYAALALVFVDLTGHKSVWASELEGWEMYESATANEWRAQGRLANARENLLRVARLRFHDRIPPAFPDAVNSETDLQKLTEWLDVAVTANSPSDLAAAIPATPQANGAKSR